MSPSQGNPPLRHLPTLTEVVQPFGSPKSPERPAAIPTPVTVDMVMAQIIPVLESEMRRSAQEVLEAHLTAAIPQAVERIRQAVEEAFHPNRHSP